LSGGENGELVMRGRLCVVILAVAGGLAAGCGTGRSPAGALSAAVADTAATTSRVAVWTTLSSPGVATTITAVGEFDYAHRRGVLRLGGLRLGGVEVRYLPPRAYVKVPQVPGVPFLKGKAWIGISLPSRAVVGGVPFLPLGGVSANPVDLLSALTGMGGKVTDMGPATVRGVAVTHYRAVVDLAKAEAHQRPQARAEFHSFVSAVGSATLRVDVWVDRQARVRRIAISLPRPQSSGLPAGFRISETADYYDFGIPVQVFAPPASEVLSPGAFSQSITNGVSSSGGGFGQPSPPPVSGELSASQASAAEQAVRTFWAALSSNSARAVERSVVPSQRSCIAGFVHATTFKVSSLRITAAKPAGTGKATVWFSVKATIQIGGQTFPLSPPGASGTNWLSAAEVSGIWYTDLSNSGSGILPPCAAPRPPS
jgi:hypothetical protein